MGIFERFLGSGSLECLKAFLIYQQVPLPIFSGVVGLISLKVIAPTAYVGSWALIVLIISSKFLLDSRSFFLG
jgi:hypothetical protein